MKTDNALRSVALRSVALLAMACGVAVLSAQTRPVRRVEALTPPAHRSESTPPNESDGTIALSERPDTMTNVQVPRSASAVNVPVTGTGPSPSYPVSQAPPAAGQFSIVLPLGMLAAGAVAVPASGASTAYGAFTVTNTGATVAVGGTTFPVLSLAATAAVGTNYELLQTASSGSAPFGYALFDVVAAPPVAPNAPTGMTATGGYTPLEVV